MRPHLFQGEYVFPPPIRRSSRLAILIGAAVCAAAPHLTAQTPAPAPTCRQSLDSLDAKTRRNYAGFLLEIRDDRRAAYQEMLGSAATRADRTPLNACYPVLADYAAWFDDPHLFVFQSQAVDSATARTRAAALPRVALTEAGVRADLARRESMLDPIEGIWYDGPLRIAIVPDPTGTAGRFLGVVLTADSSAWPAGAVRAHFTRQENGAYTTTLLTRGFAELQLTARIHKRVLLRLSPGIWGRAFPLATADTGLVDPDEPRRPRVSVRERSVVFSIPSHDPRFLPVLDSLVASHLPAIRERALLIVDLRGNEGGGSLTTRALHPLIASAERRATPFDSMSAMMLSSPDQIDFARRVTGTDTSTFVRDLVARMEANPGGLVPLQPGTPPPARPDSVVPGDWQVAVLVDRGTVSASEVTVLMALRSTRAVVIGEPTAGALDYQSTFIVGLGTGDRRWALGYPTITAHADLPRRGMRGRGIAPEVFLAWDGVADPLGEVERRLLR